MGENSTMTDPRFSPDPTALHPLPHHQGTVFLKPLLAQAPNPLFSVGDYSYYSDFGDPLPFFARNVRYAFGRSRLSIGRYCALAHGTTFVLDDANHVLSGITSYPFPIFGGEWAAAVPLEALPLPNKGDTSVGHDVWFGYEALVLPGVSIGTGCIVGARAVVSRDLPPYSVAAGNPARVVRQRFPAEVVGRLLKLAWWDWPHDAVTAAIPLLVQGDVAALEAFRSRR